MILCRTYSAGVHFGNREYVSPDGKLVTLTNARRIWQWSGANTLNEIANHGVDITSSKISEPVKRITLTEVIEIIELTPEAEDNLNKAKWS